jgi:crotonobetainyl-CoA:carnitine CoA-transferase CaiB-like acyl-CoA transferase
MLSPMDGALTDLTVLDLSRVLAGPFAAQLLGDLGADVVKVERPGVGDDTRAWGPPFTVAGESAYFLCANRNKRSVAIDLASPDGCATVRALARRADVVLENFRTGTMARLGLDLDRLRADNPRLVTCSITGFGTTGPEAGRAGYDNVIQAEGGFVSITGDAASEGFKVGVAVADLAAGLYAATAILAAIHRRARTGRGDHVEVALFDAQLSLLANVGSAWLVSNEAPRRHGNAHPTIVPYQPFATADGRLMLACGNDRQFRTLSEVLGRPAWAEDPRFRTNPARVEHRATLIPLVAGRFATRTTSAWIEALGTRGVPCGPVNDIPTALDSAQARARDQVVEWPDDGAGPLRLPGTVPRLADAPVGVRRRPPRLGEHTDEILRDLLEYDDDRIAALRAAGAIA